MSTNDVAPNVLHPDDIADLRRSGLSDETIRSMGCYSAETDIIRRRTGVQKVASGGYSIPYAGITDQTGGPYIRWRLRQPVEKMRYASGQGDDAQLYIPPALTALPDSDLLVITEGEKKAAKAVQEGIHCVAVQGVWSWCDPDSRAIEKHHGNPTSPETEPLPALMELLQRYKRVLVLGDLDLMSNPQARQGFERLAKSLGARHIRVAVSFCPPLAVSDGEDLKIRKQGLDDWLVANRFLAVRSLPALFRAAELNRDGITDNYNAIEFAEQFRDRLAFSQDIWRWWNGLIWTKDDCWRRRALVPELASIYSSTADDLSTLSSGVVAPYRGIKQTHWPEEISSWYKSVESSIKDLRGAAHDICNLRGIDAALAIAQSYLRVPDNAWDADPYLLAVKNGVVDLRTGELLPALPQQRITRSAGAAYDSAATAESFVKFLGRVQPEVEVRKYLQLLAGYSAIGESNEQKFFTFVGSGANGKSTYVGLLMAALGDYAVKGPLSLLAQQSPEKPRNDLAALAGARLVSFSETPDNLRVDEEMIKSITGEDLVAARFLNREFFQFMPRFTPILDTNHPPRPKDTGDAIWRRVAVVPWSVKIPQHEQDKRLRKRLLMELPGILNWIVQGAREFLERGLIEPATVAKASRALRLSCDDLGRWMDDCVVQEPQYRVRSSDLYRSYLSWCEEEGVSSRPSQKGFSTSLREKGFVLHKSNGNSVWLGLRVRPSVEGPDDRQAISAARLDVGALPAPDPATLIVPNPGGLVHLPAPRLPSGGYIV
ncbi:MAG: phage/plasmid primase, P4 family [Acidobacteriaceae bacterium]